jgi:hypothetical protein
MSNSFDTDPDTTIDDADEGDQDATVNETTNVPSVVASEQSASDTNEMTLAESCESTDVDAADPDSTQECERARGDVPVWEASLADDSNPNSTLKDPEPAVTQVPTRVGTLLGERMITRPDQTSADSSDGPDYSIEQLLGEGGMGAVYLACQRSMDRSVAIKVLKPSVARRTSSHEAFVSEAIITGGLDHPNIVPIYEVGTQADSLPFYSMKQVQGVEWRDRFDSNSLAENIDVLMRVADAVAFAHSRHIIHRDLKPANIMLGQFGEVLVMDWGLAMPTRDHPRREQFPRPKWGGTPLYMAPEMADRLVVDLDHRSDVYLLGAILFEIVTGKPPHELDRPPEARRAATKACLEAALANRIASTDKEGELMDIARKALATSPEHRHQSVAEFQAEIRAYQSHTESIALAARAGDDLASAAQSNGYDGFGRAIFGLEEALALWPENATAAT